MWCFCGFRCSFRSSGLKVLEKEIQLEITSQRCRGCGESSIVGARNKCEEGWNSLGERYSVRVHGMIRGDEA